MNKRKGVFISDTVFSSEVFPNLYLGVEFSTLLVLSNLFSFAPFSSHIHLFKKKRLQKTIASMAEKNMHPFEIRLTVQ